MMKVEEMVQWKDKLGFSFSYISRNSGVPMGTLQKIFGGITKTPRYETLQQLEKFFLLEQKEAQYVSVNRFRVKVKRPYYEQYSNPDLVREPASYGVAPKKQGSYTIRDYEEMPEDVRVELIDGVIYDMSAPSVMHQMIAVQILSQITAFLKKKNGSCMPGMAPLDVQLDEDDFTMVQPDLFIVCDPSRFSSKRMHGAPDFVLEIMSPSTRRKDGFLKLFKYVNAGVREYWIVDPERKSIVVYFAEETGDCLPKIYTFEEEVPVQIFGEELRIDFVEIWEKVGFLEAE